MTTLRSTVARLTAGTLLTCGVLALTALPAAAEPSVGWPDSAPVDGVRVVLLLGGIPVLLFLGILAFVMLPPIMRGETVRPEWSLPSSDQWLGGPQRDVGQLAAPDDKSSEAGGASGRW